jgi:hypothetical protein
MKFDTPHAKTPLPTWLQPVATLVEALEVQFSWEWVIKQFDTTFEATVSLLRIDCLCLEQLNFRRFPTHPFDQPVLTWVGRLGSNGVRRCLKGCGGVMGLGIRYLLKLCGSGDQ